MSRWHNLGDLVDRTADPSLPAVIDLRDADNPRHWTHGAFDRLSSAVARSLQKAGLQRGDAVAIAALNRAEYLAAYFGIMRAGLVAVPVNIKLPAPAIAHVLNDAQVRLAFIEQPFQDLLPADIPRVDFDNAGTGGFQAFVNAPQDASERDDWDAFPSVQPDRDEVAQILYTSGSTGLPKGVPLSHAGQLWALSTTFQAGSPPERFLLAQPLFHMNGLFMCKRVFAGNSLVVIQPRFQAEAYAAAMAHYRITAITAVPTMFARLVRDPALLAGRAFPDLRRLTLGSAPITLGLLQRIQAAFPQTTISLGYGTTEAGPAVFGPHPDGLPTPPLSLGYQLPTVELALHDGPDADHGVLHMRNPAVLSAYRNLPEKSAQVLHDGWYDSGDVMSRDAQGFYYFVGRADDMFVCAGENIYPGEVEKLLESHPAVRQACVVPLQDEERAHIPAAFIVPAEGAQLSFDQIKTHALQHGPAYQHPRRAHLLDDLPWAGTNKIDRNALRHLAEQLERDNAWNTTASNTAGLATDAAA